MSERGVFAVDRGIFTDPDFAQEPFTEREAFLWLVSEAAWKTRKVRVGSSVQVILRGQVSHSIRFMAQAWQWSKSRVDRFLGRLEKRDMIRCESGTAITVITICKYDAFQRVSLPERDSNGTESGTAAGQQRDRLEDKENIETKGRGDARARTMARETFPPNAFGQFWCRYPHKVGERAAREAFERVRTSDTVLFSELMLGLDRYCRSKPPDRQWCNPSTFLRDGRWTDEPASEPAQRSLRLLREPSRGPPPVDRPTGQVARLAELYRQRSEEPSDVRSEPEPPDRGDELIDVGDPVDDQPARGRREDRGVAWQTSTGRAPADEVLRAAAHGAYRPGEAADLRRRRKA